MYLTHQMDGIHVEDYDNSIVAECISATSTGRSFEVITRLPEPDYRDTILGINYVALKFH